MRLRLRHGKLHNTGRKRIVPHVLTVLLTSAVVPVSAQERGPLPLPAVFSGSGASPSLSQFNNLNNQQTDVIFGRNAKGPYLLSWKGFRSGTETVRIVFL